MRKALFLSVFALAGLVSFNAAAADELGEPGQLTLGAERVFGLNFWSGTFTPDGSDTDLSAHGTSVGLVMNSGSPTPYTIPRLALDYMVADGVSIGGSIGYLSQTGKQDVPDGTGGTTEQDLNGVNGFLIAPRVGYVIPVSDGIDFWVRGGITYYSQTTEGTPDDTTTSGLGLGAEGALVISPIAGFGFTIGPTIDFGLSGTQKTGDAESDLVYRNFGLNGGLVGWF